jgi:transposase
MTKKRSSTNPGTADSSGGTRRRFDASFKQEAVTLAKRIGFRQAAQDLGVGESNLRNWAAAMSARGVQAFAPLSQRTDVDSELRRLREENRVLRMERDILKKAATYFAKESE